MKISSGEGILERGNEHRRFSVIMKSMIGYHGIGREGVDERERFHRGKLETLTLDIGSVL